MTMETNSRWLVPSKKHVQDRDKDLDYIQEMVGFLDRRGGRVWDVELRDEYNGILIKHGVISGEALTKSETLERRNDGDSTDRVTS